jgi:hypothetical protein
VHDCLPAEIPGAPLWARHEMWIVSIDNRPRIHVYTITCLQKIEPECRFVGLFRHLGIIKVFLVKNTGIDMFGFDECLTCLVLDQYPRFSGRFANLFFNFEDCLEAVFCKKYTK